jgi:hypothetical protein
MLNRLKKSIRTLELFHLLLLEILQEDRKKEKQSYRKKSSFFPNPAGPDQIKGTVPRAYLRVFPYINQGLI